MWAVEPSMATASEDRNGEGETAETLEFLSLPATGVVREVDEAGSRNDPSMAAAGREPATPPGERGGEAEPVATPPTGTIAPEGESATGAPELRPGSFWASLGLVDG